MAEELERGKWGGSDEALLKEIRDNYDYAVKAWERAHENRKLNMRYLAGDPWDPEDRKAREDKDNPRPCISEDELNQYVNQCVNSARQNKRGMKAEPEASVTNEETAEFEQDLMRTIEYKSRAQAIYLQAYQDEVEGGYGFCRVSRRYISNDPDDVRQEIVIRPIPNPDSVLYDPDCKEPDWSDAEWCFVLEPMTREQFKGKYPDATAKDFTSEDARRAPAWIQEKKVLVAEYWKVETTLVEGSKRSVEKKTLRQYVTNGIEILEQSDQLGEEIPIPAFIGLQRWVDDGDGPRRTLSGLVDLARNPQMALAYLSSQEMEEAGLSPKVPYVGYVGQFETDKDAWDTASKAPHGYLQADPVVDAATGQVLPLPRREPFTPNFAAYEVARESKRRAIQAAMGVMPLPTAAQRQNQKSGVALHEIKAQQEVGSFHFVDGFERGLQRLGRIVDSWIPATYDWEGDLWLRTATGDRYQARINTAEPYLNPKTQKPEHFPVAKLGKHAVTVSTAPSAASQRDAASDFLDLLVGNLQGLPIPPEQKARLLSLAVKMKELGPLGDEMADLIAPPDPQNIPPEALPFMQPLQQQLQGLNSYAKQLEAEVQKLRQQAQAKVIDNEYRLELQRMKDEAQIAAAEIATKAQRLDERLAFVETLLQRAHERGMQAMDQAHELAMAQQAQDAAASAAATAQPAAGTPAGDQAVQQ